VVCLERPGVGRSTDHVYADLRGWAPDVAAVADRLGHERFLIVGLSGGGPYALACGHELPQRVVAIGLLGSLVPTAGDDAAAGGLVALTHRFNREMTLFRRPLGHGLWAFVRTVNPLAHVVYSGFARVMPPGDRRVLTDPDNEAMFVDDLTSASTRQFQAMINDLVLIGRPWGFRLADVRVPIRWWHGDADPFVPLDQAQRTAARLPDAQLFIRPEESHLGDFGAADEVLEVLAREWGDAA
jgi:pimeloyl-ACP methyl ester carboxylesterase